MFAPLCAAAAAFHERERLAALEQLRALPAVDPAQLELALNKPAVFAKDAAPADIRLAGALSATLEDDSPAVRAAAARALAALAATAAAPEEAPWRAAAAALAGLLSDADPPVRAAALEALAALAAAPGAPAAARELPLALLQPAASFAADADAAVRAAARSLLAGTRLLCLPALQAAVAALDAAAAAHPDERAACFRCAAAVGRESAAAVALHGFAGAGRGAAAFVLYGAGRARGEEAEYCEWVLSPDDDDEDEEDDEEDVPTLLARVRAVREAGAPALEARRRWSELRALLEGLRASLARAAARDAQARLASELLAAAAADVDARRAPAVAANCAAAELARLRLRLQFRPPVEGAEPARVDGAWWAELDAFPAGRLQLCAPLPARARVRGRRCVLGTLEAPAPPPLFVALSRAPLRRALPREVLGGVAVYRASVGAGGELDTEIDVSAPLAAGETATLYVACCAAIDEKLVPVSGWEALRVCG